MTQDIQNEGMSFIECEYCPRCEANLTLQKGYCNTLPYWICLGCGEMLINPSVEGSDIAWICDGCGAMLNIQPGFDEDVGKWTCTECGYVNVISDSEVYASEEEYRSMLKSPMRGLSDEEVLELSYYEDIEDVADRWDITLVRHRGTGQLYVRKLLTIYNKSVFMYLKANPVPCMPVIEAVYESDNCLIVIEEYVEGETLDEILEQGPLPENTAVYIAWSILNVLKDLHSLPRPIIHRDVKPSNIMIKPDGQIYLLDMNAAKWFDPDETDDTRYIGTQNYAAPEQAGFGLTASSAQSDIYAVGILLNVMLTGCFPKDRRATGRIWDVIAKCINLKAEERYTDKELMQALSELF